MRADMRYAEDQEWLFRAIRSGWLVRGIAERTVRYRITPSGLSASTEKMLDGWKAFIAIARELEPAIVARELRAAYASMQFYLAQRAVRAEKPARISFAHLMRAIVAKPARIAASPLKFAALAIACVVPALANRAVSKFRMTSHG
jgi:hypothetical protein